MLRVDNAAGFVKVRRSLRSLLTGRWGLATGRTLHEERWRRGALQSLVTLQGERPVAVLDLDHRVLWAFHDRFYWGNDSLDHRDVQALVAERERRDQRRLERAHALLASERAPTAGGVERAGIPLEVKRRVWERCGGHCVECQSDQLLEFDHVIPLAMGGSSTERNLQLLCAECNRAKGDGL